jgi:hypothetical protein
MILIWYNPDADKYEIGLRKDYFASTLHSQNQDRFLILYEFEGGDYSPKLASKVIENLNVARSIAPKRQEIFA